MKFYPINLSISGKSCVVIGGGKVALRKILGLLDAGARVKVIAPEICRQVEELVNRGEISWIREKFSAALLEDEIILIAATNSVDVNREATLAARSRKILVNIVDGLDGDFNVPAKIIRGDLQITISTGANSPAFAKFIRQMLEEEFDETFSLGLSLIARKRRELKNFLPDSDSRQKFWRRILTKELWQLLKAGKLDQLEAKINYAFESLRLESLNSLN